MKKCKDCEHFREVVKMFHTEYGCDQKGLRNFVTGESIYKKCEDMRRNKYECGEEAAFFKPKKVEKAE